MNRLPVDTLRLPRGSIAGQPDGGPWHGALRRAGLPQRVAGQVQW